MACTGNDFGDAGSDGLQRWKHARFLRNISVYFSKSDFERMKWLDVETEAGVSVRTAACACMGSRGKTANLITARDLASPEWKTKNVSIN